MSEIPEILFVCVHNAGRSQMAAALLNHAAAGRVHVRSAGSTPADQINPAVVRAMDELGLDISHEFPKPLTDDVVQAADVVITMGCETPARSTPASATSTGPSTTPPASPRRRPRHPRPDRPARPRPPARTDRLTLFDRTTRLPSWSLSRDRADGTEAPAGVPLREPLADTTWLARS